MKKLIDITNIDKIKMLALKEKRRGKTDAKNWIEDVIEEYVEKNYKP